MPEYWTPFADIDTFWRYVKYFVFMVAPGIMIYFALKAFEYLYHKIMDSIGQDDDERDEDDYEVRYY